MYLKLNGYEISCEMGIRWLDALELLPEQYRVRAPLGVSVQGRTFSEHPWRNTPTRGS